ncbi:MAG: N-acetyltransferase [Bacteroidales bacterium]|nr:N-acetyltransferase [Bacteroidales bacterium]
MKYTTTNNGIYLEQEGRTLGEVTFAETSPGVFTINHTWVDGSMRGQGLASELVRRAVEHIKGKGGEVRATCSYAVSWLQRHQH